MRAPFNNSTFFTKVGPFDLSLSIYNDAGGLPPWWRNSTC